MKSTGYPNLVRARGRAQADLDKPKRIGYTLTMGATTKTRADAKADPTAEQFAAYRAMYDYFNRALFGGQLSRVVLNFSRASARTMGFFAPKRWARGTSATHEISLCPSYLATSTPKETAATFVHEMCHAWQQEHGKPGRGRYHNQEWADKMKTVGLQPSDTGEAGGAETGDSMCHYVIKGGAFDKAFAAMPKSCLLPWSSFDFKKAKAKPRPSKVKFTCPKCCANAWGKPTLLLMCGECEETMEAEEADASEAAS